MPRQIWLKNDRMDQDDVDFCRQYPKKYIEITNAMIQGVQTLPKI